MGMFKNRIRNSCLLQEASGFKGTALAGLDFMRSPDYLWPYVLSAICDNHHHGPPQLLLPAFR